MLHRQVSSGHLHARDTSGGRSLLLLALAEDDQGRDVRQQIADKLVSAGTGVLRLIGPGSSSATGLQYK